MRLAISLLVSTVIFGSLAVSSDSITQIGLDSQATTIAKGRSGSRPKRPQDPTPHRGSGRRDLMRYQANNLYSV